MKRGNDYLVRLESAPSVAPRNMKIVEIKYSSGRRASLVCVSSTRKDRGRSLTLRPLQDCPNPQVGKDLLAYSDEKGKYESRVIQVVTPLGPSYQVALSQKMQELTPATPLVSTQQLQGGISDIISGLLPIITGLIPGLLKSGAPGNNLLRAGVPPWPVLPGTGSDSGFYRDPSASYDDTTVSPHHVHLAQAQVNLLHAQINAAYARGYINGAESEPMESSSDTWTPGFLPTGEALPDHPFTYYSTLASTTSSDDADQIHDWFFHAGDVVMMNGTQSSQCIATPNMPGQETTGNDHRGIGLITD